MPVYRVGFNGRAGINTANSPIASLWTATRKCRIREVTCFIQTVQTTAPLFALQRATARGTQSTSLTPIADDPGEIAATAVLDTAWSVNPTFSTANPQIGVGGVALAAGNGFVWNFDGSLEIAIAAGLTLFNVNASGATLGTFAGHFVYEE
jgi:hypothetical protein